MRWPWGLEERASHDPVKLAEPSPVTGVGVVLHDSAVLRPVFLNDREIALIEEFGPVVGFTILHVPCDFFLQFLDGNPERDPAFSVLPGSEVAVRSDPISEEACLFRGGMRDQGLFRGQFEFELIVQECPESSLDFLGLIPWAS